MKHHVRLLTLSVVMLGLAACNNSAPDSPDEYPDDSKPAATSENTTKAAEQVTPISKELVYLDLKDGRVTIELRPDLAPKHVAQIKTLVGKGFYDGIVFHRVIDGFMAQTGDPTGTGRGGSDLPDIPAEFSKEPFVRGTVGMARAQDPNSANSQFFIMFDNGDFLNGQYTVLGHVTSGMEHVDKIKRGTGQNGMVTEPDKIIKMMLAK